MTQCRQNQGQSLQRNSYSFIVRAVQLMAGKVKICNRSCVMDWFAEGVTPDKEK